MADTPPRPPTLADITAQTLTIDITTMVEAMSDALAVAILKQHEKTAFSAKSMLIPIGDIRREFIEARRRRNETFVRTTDEQLWELILGAYAATSENGLKYELEKIPTGKDEPEEPPFIKVSW